MRERREKEKTKRFIQVQSPALHSAKSGLKCKLDVSSKFGLIRLLKFVDNYFKIRHIKKEAVLVVLQN